MTNTRDIYGRPFKTVKEYSRLHKECVMNRCRALIGRYFIYTEGTGVCFIHTIDMQILGESVYIDYMECKFLRDECCGVNISSQSLMNTEAFLINECQEVTEDEFKERFTDLMNSKRDMYLNRLINGRGNENVR